MVLFGAAVKVGLFGAAVATSKFASITVTEAVQLTAPRPPITQVFNAKGGRGGREHEAQYMQNLLLATHPVNGWMSQGKGERLYNMVSEQSGDRENNFKDAVETLALMEQDVLSAREQEAGEIHAEDAEQQVLRELRNSIQPPQGLPSHRRHRRSTFTFDGKLNFGEFGGALDTPSSDDTEGRNINSPSTDSNGSPLTEETSNGSLTANNSSLGYSTSEEEKQRGNAAALLSRRRPRPVSRPTSEACLLELGQKAPDATSNNSSMDSNASVGYSTPEEGENQGENLAPAPLSLRRFVRAHRQRTRDASSTFTLCGDEASEAFVKKVSNSQKRVSFQLPGDRRPFHGQRRHTDGFVFCGDDESEALEKALNSDDS